MKNLRTVIFIAGICLASAQSFAQNDKIPINEPDYNKPRLFDNLPARIAITPAELENVVNTQVGKPATIKFASESSLQFDGQVVSVSDNNDSKFQSVVVRSANFPGANLTVSKILNDDGSYSYTGRIISFQHGDLFELKKENGGYVLVKRNFYDLVNE
ncbi:MAG TPA: hypothetical protein PKC72_12635 [Chitinophagaceae bacterium]|nr:hypothetical protein [Chitinophagaceae bacterium]